MISKQIIREYFSSKSWNNNTCYIQGIEELKIELDERFVMFEAKKKKLNKKLRTLERKNSEATTLKKDKGRPGFKTERKKLKKKLKSLNELVKG